MKLLASLDQLIKATDLKEATGRSETSKKVKLQFLKHSMSVVLLLQGEDSESNF